jgi:CubicO group peptidase (beta-lactamase class C family)
MKRILKYIFLSISLLMLWAVIVFFGTQNGWWHEPIAEQGDSGEYLNAVKEKIKEQYVGNFALALVKNGSVEYEIFHSEGKPVDRNTVFQVASLSKWVSAFGVMKLVEEGKLDLDVPVSKYLTRWQLPASEFNNDGVTVRRLLSHTAGLSDGLGYSGFEPGVPIQPIEESLTKASDADEGISGAVQVGIEPGAEFKYSGGGYTLLQLLVEEVSRQSFAS